MKIWHFILVIALAGLLALFYKGLWGDPRAIPTVLIGTPAATFSGPEVRTGEILSLNRFQGKVVLVNFWASWCLECRTEQENLLALNRRFSQRSDFVMLGIDYQDRLEDAQQYLKMYGSNFDHVRDLKGTIAIDYGVYGVPETFVIDRQGIIRYKYVGPLVGPGYAHLADDVLQPLLEGRSISRS
ncbi:MAG TPA: redoxin domain-containing protein [Nitrospiria bacterium]|nr:redoxin domain-containing protein [Nitrospiria bacterium]